MHGTLPHSSNLQDATASKWHPYVYRKGVMWGDTDSAAIGYTGRFTYWTLEAIEMFLRERVGCDWYTINVDHNFGTPFVNVNINFRSPVTPREGLLIEVLIKHVGNSSIICKVIGRGEKNHVLRFDAEATFVYADNATMKKIPIPPDFLVHFRNEYENARPLLSEKASA